METAQRSLTLKHAIDRIMAVGMLTVLWPVFTCVALAIKLDDGGDVFFRQERVGLDGAPFRIWKFRTMVPNAAELGGGFFPEGMQLITRMGRFLRKTSLDELPQLFNIAAGQMSFVGPRPTLLEQVERYTAEQRKRLWVKPGVTGWAQLHGRSEIPWSQRIVYDLEYVERVGVGFDAWILLRTIPVVLFGSGNRDTLAPEDGTDDLAGSATVQASGGRTDRDEQAKPEPATSEAQTSEAQARSSAGAFSAGTR